MAFKLLQLLLMKQRKF